MKIIDASVAIKWFVNEPVGADSALKILKDVEKNPSHYAVPDLFFAEILNVLCRITKDKHRAKETIEILEQLGIERIGMGHDVLSLAADMAIEWGISGYDAIYLATAKLTKGQWLTFDHDAIKKVKALDLARGL